jgi:RNA polymerase sigma-32 factor
MAEAVESDAGINTEYRDSKSSVNKGNLSPVERVAAPVPSGRIQALPPTPREKPLPPSGPVKSDSFNQYLSEIRRYKLLSPQDEAALLEDYQLTGNPATAKRLISSNLRLVVKIAMEFQRHWLNNLQDLVQEGNIGLLQALKKYNPTKGVKFSYYASFWIKAYMLKYIMDNWRLVKLGTTQAQRKLFYNLKKEQDKLIKAGIEPVSTLVAERLGVSEELVQEMNLRLSAGREFSLDAPVGPDNEQTYVSLLPSADDEADNILADAQMQEMVSDKLERFKETLSERELIILNKRLLSEEPVTLQELGEEFGVSRERIRQLEERLKRTIKKYLLQELPELDFH